MAIYSLHHSSIGKTTQANPYTAAAHVRYITRSSAASRIEAQRLPAKPHQIAAFMVEAENNDRKNARVADKLMLALPRELDGEQRAALIRRFAEEITRGRAPWLAAFHDKGKDAHNPHVHLLIRDRDPVTAKRVAGLSEKGTTQQLRTLWEVHANQALEAAGHRERIDHRSLSAQGITREPTVHEGPKAQQMDRRGARAKSRVRQVRNRPGSRRRHRDVDYAAIDAGRSRPDYNRAILAEEGPDEWWEAIYTDNQQRELDQLRQLHHPPASVDLALVARPPVAEARQSIDKDNVTLLARLDKTNVDGEKAHPVREVTKEPSKALLNGQHGKLYHRLKIEGKKMTDDRTKKKPQDKLAVVEAALKEAEARFDRLLKQSYQDAGKARDEMDAFLDKHGYQELLATIRADGNEFGAPPDDPGMRNDAPKYRSELYVSLADFWKLTDKRDELAQALASQKQERVGTAPVTESGPQAKAAATSQREGSTQAAPAAPSVKPGQKSPAEIRAAIATWKAGKRPEAGQIIVSDREVAGEKPRTPAEIRAAIAARKAKNPHAQAAGQGAGQGTTPSDGWDVDDF